jgi:hypothetical protein
MVNVTSTTLTPSMLLGASPNRPVVSVDPTATDTSADYSDPPSIELGYRQLGLLVSVLSPHPLRVV